MALQQNDALGTSGTLGTFGTLGLVRVLLIRLRLIGDVVFTTPAVGAIRRRFPEAHLTYLIEAPAEPVVRHHPALDAIIDTIFFSAGWLPS